MPIKKFIYQNLLLHDKWVSGKPEDRKTSLGALATFLGTKPYDQFLSETELERRVRESCNAIKDAFTLASREASEN